MDLAGNTSTPVPLALVLDNYPPSISVPASWDFSVSAALSVQPNVIPLENVKITLQGDGQTLSLFDGLPAPSSISWNRSLNGFFAQPGEYPVNVKACDLYGMCVITTSEIIVPQYATPVPSPTLSLTPSPTPPPAPKTPSRVVYPPVRKIVSPPQIAKVIPPAIPIAPPALPASAIVMAIILSWPVEVTSFIVLMFSFVLLLDRRPSALRSLARTIAKSIKPFKE
jgi:hypothetical protein